MAILSRRPPVVAGMGARASLGASAEAVGAAYRAGLSRHRQHPSLLGRKHTPLVVAMDPRLPADVPLERRLIEMVTDVAAQALAPLDALAPRPALDIVVALPDAGPGIDPRVSERVVGALRERLGDLRGRALEAVPGGRSAGLLALETAVGWLTTGKSAACLWCGVDSYLAPVTLDALDRAGALHDEGARWGFVPGEAAAACLLLPGGLAGPPALAFVGAVSTAVEQRDADDVALGLGLTSATRAVLGALPSGERLHRVYADLNGEHERVDDVGFTLARISDRLAALPCLTTPADRLGEVGAASAPLFAALAVTAAQHGRATGPNVLLWTTGPGQRAGAALLTIPVRARER